MEDSVRSSFNTNSSNISNNINAFIPAAAAVAIAAPQSINMIEDLLKNGRLRGGQGEQPFSFRQNLVSILNDPHHRKQDSDIFTKTWGTSFSSPSITMDPKAASITRESFMPYLTRIIHSNRAQLARIASDVMTASTSNAVTASSNNVVDAKYSPSAERTQQALNTRAIAASLYEVPSMYFHPEFSLEEAETFEGVLQVDQHKNSSADGRLRMSSVASKVLEEKLSHYLDLVEQQLARQIASRSQSFFKALTFHDALRNDVAHCCATIASLRAQIAKVDHILAGRSLRAVSLARRRANLVAVSDKLRLMVTVRQSQPTIQLLLASSDLMGALDLIASTQAVLGTDLKGIHSFRHLGQQLSELENIIENMMESDFVKLVVSQLPLPYEDENDANNENEILEYSSPEIELFSGLLEERLMPLVFGMLRKRKFDFLAAYSRFVLGAVKAALKRMVRKVMSSSITNRAKGEELEQVATALPLSSTVATEVAVGLNDSDVPLSPPLHEVALGLGSSELLELLQLVFNQSIDILSAMQSTHVATLEVLEAASTMPFDHESSTRDCSSLDDGSKVCVTNVPRPPLVTPDVQTKLGTESSDIVFVVAELIQSRCSRLLSAFEDTLLSFRSSTFFKFVHSVDSFVEACDARVGGKAIHGLKGTLLALTKQFVERYHRRCISELNIALEAEQWKVVDVPASAQASFDKARALSINENSTDDDVANPTTLVADVAIPMTTSVWCGDDKQFQAVHCLLVFGRISLGYVEIVTAIPSIPADVLHRFVDILKLFNSRICQLVLGAGARHLAGLTTITAKHLALASQALSVIIVHIPVYKNAVASMMPSKQRVLLADFDRVLEDYENHRQEIFSKLVSIMNDCFTRHVGREKGWRDELKSSASAYMASLVRDATKLHKVLSDILPQDQLEIVFSQVFSLFNSRLRAEFSKQGVGSKSSRKGAVVPPHLIRRVLADLSYYIERLSSLDNVTGPGDSLLTYIREVQGIDLLPSTSPLSVGTGNEDDGQDDVTNNDIEL